MSDDLEQYLPPVKEREEIAAGQVEQFKRELYAHVLNKRRLEALPVADEATQQAVVEADAAIETIKSAIDSTLSVEGPAGA